MNKVLGIRHEDKYALERRVAITPKHVKKLIADGLKVLVQDSPKRVFPAEAYKEAGAEITRELKDAPVIFGVKEMPPDFFEPRKTYIFFSHVIKGQHYNMPMLKRMMELECNLIDYEKVEDEMGRRMIFFGRYAGLAGMINTLWALGLRLESLGHRTPFLHLRQAKDYASLEEARSGIIRAGMEIARNGLPEEICPLTIGFTGYGNVSNGAQEIAALLPVQEIDPDDLLKLHKQGDLPNNVVYKTVFKEHHLSEPLNPEEEFDLEDYYKNPHFYRSAFDKYIPHLSVLVNGMYWDTRYPKLITKAHLERMYFDSQPKMLVIGDITCDINGSIESTVKAAPIEDPIFVYDPFTQEITSGFEGRGMQMMTVDILPSELPKEASEHFSMVLSPLVTSIVQADYGLALDELDLPAPIRKALILHQGELTPSFRYIQKYL